MKLTTLQRERENMENAPKGAEKRKKMFSKECNTKLNFFEHSHGLLKCNQWTNPNTRANDQECKQIELAMRETISQCSSHFGYGFGKK